MMKNGKENGLRCGNLGLEYVSDKTRKIVPAKQEGVGCNCSGRTEAANVNWCKYHVLTENERDEIFCQFYKIGDYNAQNAFLFGLISRQECSGIYLKKRKNENSSRRHVSFIYRVKDSHGQLNRVCSKGFCDVFGISKRRLSTARGDRKVNISQSNGNDSEDEEEGCNTSKVSPPVDHRKALPTPKIPTGLVFYLRQLWVYNLGVYVCNKKTAFMCMWPENIASRVPGHTFLPSDRDFGVIEKKIRKTDYVFTPDDWFRLVENSRLKNPFQVLRMGTEDFKNFHNAASLIVRNQKNALGRKMPLRKIAILRIQATKPGILQYKTKYSDICPWEEVQVFYKPAGRPNKGKNLAMPSQETLRKIFLPSNMECLYPAGRKISAKKHKDLMSLLPYIPQNHHAVYYALQPDNLTAAEEVEDDPDN
ncbi:hypothetical protein ANN_08268 [Periplaneta americana]|uniref:Uncharacterized protein n=1 Tax=Periplaneta americana TaxID=6978 RepID=A0ABQ8T366_PERAM|nr:hypothetical protein ANN_08268 [Periplaneta americana]